MMLCQFYNADVISIIFCMKFNSLFDGRCKKAATVDSYYRMVCIKTFTFEIIIKTNMTEQINCEWLAIYYPSITK